MTELEAFRRLKDLRMAIKTYNRMYMDPFNWLYNSRLLLINVKKHELEIRTLEETFHLGEFSDSLDLKTRKNLYREDQVWKLMVRAVERIVVKRL